jgi:hypothetical protein
MSSQDFVSRQLDDLGCKIVGTQLGTDVAEFKKNKPPLADKLQKALDDTATITESISLLVTDDIPMPVVDRGADRGIGGLDDLLEAMIKTLQPASYLALSASATARFEKVKQLHELCFKEGTSYLRAEFEIEWGNLEKLGRVLRGDQAKGLTEALGLTEEVARSLQWIDRYGAQMGITEAKRDDRTKKLVVLIPAWHQAYQRVVVQAYATYDNNNDPIELQSREVFLLPYRNFVEKQREADRLARAESRKKVQEATDKVKEEDKK